jgi:hypothetical protein
MYQITDSLYLYWALHTYHKYNLPLSQHGKKNGGQSLYILHICNSMVLAGNVA